MSLALEGGFNSKLIPQDLTLYCADHALETFLPISVLQSFSLTPRS